MNEKPNNLSSTPEVYFGNYKKSISGMKRYSRLSIPLRSDHIAGPIAMDLEQKPHSKHKSVDAPNK